MPVERERYPSDWGRIAFEKKESVGWRAVPHIKYKISTSIPMKGDFSATLADRIFLEEGPEGLMVIQEGEQTSML